MLKCLEGYEGLVLSIVKPLLRYTTTVNDADDIYQDALLGLCRGLEKYDPSQSKESTYLSYRIRAEAIDGIRRMRGVGRGRNNKSDRLPISRAIGYYNPILESMIFKDDIVHLRNAIYKIDKRYREIIQLYYYSGLTQKDIGILLGASESRISQLRKEALEQLRVAFERS